MLGIDLYQRYNLVSDWHLVYADGVRECYVKLTDGAGPAAVRGDAYVAGARAAGIRVGGYHFMESSPAPEVQADVFAAELHRLGALDIAPALDLEAPSIPVGSRADYARRFLLRLQASMNMSRVVLYASASWMATLRPDTWGIAGLLNWTAQYGANDGKEHAVTAYTGHVNVHQYTSSAHLPGITGAVDLDDVLSDITEPAPATPTTAKDDDMAVITGDWPAGTDEYHVLACPVGSASAVLARAWFSLVTGYDPGATGHIWLVGTNTDGTPHYYHDQEFTLAADSRQWWELPDGADQVSVKFTSTTPVAWCLEMLPK